VGEAYQFTLINAHLKSKRPVPGADQAEMRLAEARQLRARVLELLRDKEANVLVVGDLNDTPNAKPVRAVIGRRPKRLVDLRPAEQPGAEGQRRVVWTVYYKTEDAFDRFDYLLASPGMAREWRPAGTRVLAWPGWGKASDHRPIIAEFTARDE
jgi:endonuclease/exonuclease/phosphatase family metal-dependent hydrolase